MITLSCACLNIKEETKHRGLYFRLFKNSLVLNFAILLKSTNMPQNEHIWNYFLFPKDLIFN